MRTASCNKRGVLMIKKLGEQAERFRGDKFTAHFWRGNRPRSSSRTRAPGARGRNGGRCARRAATDDDQIVEHAFIQPQTFRLSDLDISYLGSAEPLRRTYGRWADASRQKSDGLDASGRPSTPPFPRYHSHAKQVVAMNLDSGRAGLRQQCLASLPACMPGEPRPGHHAG